ncbi:lytic transglycosylase domain-containing protein [uncultured Clostridium sp.]|uniref:lytic transglycosylase domain-containing protein n=1 Tax=uncultured Clostridium sp. TaxID=59620 RepID=UPI0025F192B1|nr:lytic transglycosylase domain-containing protein [uncultured Clostridium sp.]
MKVNQNNSVSNEELLTAMAMNNASGSNSDSNVVAFASLLEEVKKTQQVNNSAKSSVSVDTNLLDLPLRTSGYRYVGVQGISVNNSNVKVVDNSRNVSCDLMTRIENAADKAAAKYGIDKDLIMAIINHESGFQPDVTSSAGAQGLMQILPSNFADLDISDGYNIEQNVDGGTKLLKKCIEMYGGNVEMGMIAYAGGCGVMKSRGVESYDDLYKMPAEARKAVPEILEGYKLRKESR